MDKRIELREEIKKLTDIWYQIVGLDHHKDRDCHWYINEKWSYGDYPTYEVCHYGYIYSEVSITTNSYEEAQVALIGVLKRAIKGEADWARKALKSTEDYDSIGAENAEIIVGILAKLEGSED